MSGPLIADGFRDATQMLEGVSRGVYRGPGVSAESIAEAVSATEGLDAGQLVTATQAAVGESSATTLQGGILGQVARTLGEVALGEILRRVVDHARDWFDNRDRSDGLLHDSRDSAEALEDIDAVAETACTEVVLALRAVIMQLCTFLHHLDPAVHTREFSECVGAGAALIEDAGQMILDCCRDRDTAVTACLDEFLLRGTAVCEEPVCLPRAEVADCPPAAQPSPGPTAPLTTPSDVPEVSQAVTPSPAADPAPEPSPPKPLEVPTTPQAMPVPEPMSAPEGPVVTEDVYEGTPAGESCCGVIGAVGVGIALLGLALLIESLGDCLVVPEEAVEPEQPQEPVLPAEPAAVEPVPEPDLAAVPEPPPPPKQAGTTPVPPSPEPPPPPAPAGPGNARKAGVW